MGTQYVDVKPALLDWAVDRAGGVFTLPKTQQAYYKAWVSQDKKPTFKQLENFAKATSVALPQLFLSSPPVEHLPLPDFRTIANSHRESPSGNLLDTIYACQVRQDWFIEYALTNGFEPLPWVGSCSVDLSAEECAQQVIELLDFSVEQRKNLSSRSQVRRYVIDALENLGVLVMVSGIVGMNTRRQLDVTEFRGFSLADSLAPLIFVNGRDSENAQIFTLLHEFAHLLLGGSAISDSSYEGQTTNKVELWCNAVAAAALIPGEEMKSFLQKHPEDSAYVPVARHFKTSTMVAIKRMFDVGAISFERHQELIAYEQAAFAQRPKKARSVGGDFYRTTLMRLGSTFTHAVTSSVAEGRTTYSEAFRLLGTRRADIVNQLSQRIAEL